MPRFRLEALAPRSYCLGRGSDGKLRWATFTAEDCQAQAAKITRMIRSSVSIPVSWEHREDQRPARLSRDDWESERAKGTAGWLDSLEFDTATNKLFPIVEIPDEADAKRAEALRFCSPEFRPDVVDGYGNEWGYAMTHLALTPRPRHQGQQPIQRLSGDSAVTDTVVPVIRLSVDPYKGSDMADEPKPGDKPPEKPKADDKPKSDAPPKDEKPKATDEEVASALGTIIQALRDGGMNIPPEVVDVPGLVIAIKAITGAGSTDPLDPLNPNAPKPEEVNPGGGNGGAPIMMSLEERLAKRDEKTITRERTELERRLDALVASGRASAAEVKVKKADFAAVRLSVSDAGDVSGHDRLLGWIEAKEAAPTTPRFSLNNNDNPNATRLSNANPEPPPVGSDPAAEKAKIQDDAKKEAKRVSA